MLNLVWIDPINEPTESIIFNHNNDKFKDIVNTFYKPSLSKMVIGVKEAAFARIDQEKFRDFKIHFSSIHCVDNSMTTLASVREMVQKLEFDTAATIKWRYKAVYDNNRTNSNKIEHIKDGNFINSVTEDGFNLSNVRSWSNRLEPVDLVICTNGGSAKNIKSTSTNYAILFAMKMSKSAFIVKLHELTTITRCIIKILNKYGTVEIKDGYLCVRDYHPVGKILYTRLLDHCDKPDLKVVELI